MSGLVPDDHDQNEDASYAELRFTFYSDGTEKDDEGNPKMIVGQMEAHIHHVDEAALVDTLLVYARMLVANRMGDSMFNERVPQEVRDTAASMLATNWLTNRLNSGELIQTKPIEFSVPDDLSGLVD